MIPEPLLERFEPEGPPSRSAGGGRVRARDRATGRTCLLRWAETPEESLRLGRAARVAAHLEHPGVARLEYYRPPEGGAGALLAREYVEGRSLADIAASPRKLTEGEAVAVLRESARTLLELEEFHPPIRHGGLGPSRVVLAPGDRVSLLEPEGDCPDGAGGDLSALAEAVRGALRGAPAASARFAALLERARAGGCASVRDFLDALERLPSVPPLGSGPPDERLRFSITRVLRVSAVAAPLSYLAMLAVFEWWPNSSYARARRAEPKDWPFYREFGCAGFTAPPAMEGRNAAVNPGLEGPCGWGQDPYMRREVLRQEGARAGKYYFRIEKSEEFIYQHIDLSALAPLIESGGAAVTVSAFVRADGAPRDGGPRVYIYAYLGKDADAKLLGGTDAPAVQGAWVPVSKAWSLPRGTRRLSVTLYGAEKDAPASFDDVEVVVRRAS